MTAPTNNSFTKTITAPTIPTPQTQLPAIPQYTAPLSSTSNKVGFSALSYLGTSSESRLNALKSYQREWYKKYS